MKIVILGIGTDLTNIDRIKKMLECYGDRFRDKVFCKSENEQAVSQKEQANSYAKRWAAKEAFSKALGTGIGRGLSWQNMAVHNLKSGEPTMVINGWAETRLNQITPRGHKSKIHISLSDDYPWAQAFIIIESNPV